MACEVSTGATCFRICQPAVELNILCLQFLSAISQRQTQAHLLLVTEKYTFRCDILGDELLSVLKIAIGCQLLVYIY